MYHDRLSSESLGSGLIGHIDIDAASFDMGARVRN
jgi:hypothetical protein